jgi:uncharacterized protein (TIGR03086 family)
MLDLAPAARQVERLADGVFEDQLAAPTPCPAYTVRDLLAHLLGLTAAFRDAAVKHRGPTTETSPDAAGPGGLADDWRSRLPRQLAELVAAWRDPAAWEGATRAGGVTLPGQVAGLVAVNELVIHAWDLARATGQDYTGDAASVESSIALLSQDTDEASRREGPFGPVVHVPEDAPALDRAVALSGRSPLWEPPQ